MPTSQSKAHTRNPLEARGPVLLVYGDQDWAPPAERERTRSVLAHAKFATRCRSHPLHAWL